MATKSTFSIDQINALALYGKIPPQAIEVEEVVLGALILEADAIISNRIKPEWFYKDEHQKIVKQIIDIAKEGSRVDLVTVVNRLKENNLLDEVGGPKFIAELIRKVASSAHIKQHLKIIQDKWVRREIIRMSSEIQSMSYDESLDVDDILHRMNSDTLGILEFEEESVRDMAYATNLLWQRIKQNENSTDITGIPTGFRQLDKFTGGWQNSDLIVIAAETSQGKTSLVLTFSMTAALSGKKGAIYSLEMSLLQLTARFAAMQSKVSSKKILFENLNSFDLTRVEEGIYCLAPLPIYVDDNVNNTLESICMSIRRMKIKYGIQYAVVDYIQNIKEVQGRNEEGSLGIITKTLKNLAKELDMVIFAVSQLSRNKERPIPNINRLRGSGQIEETADVILTIYRPEYYNIQSYPEPWENEPTKGTAMITIAKGRNIGTGSFIANFEAYITMFTDTFQVIEETVSEYDQKLLF